MADSSVDPQEPTDPDEANVQVVETHGAVEAELEKRLANPELEKVWRGQNDLIYSALIAVGVVMVQPFLVGPKQLACFERR